MFPLFIAMGLIANIVGLLSFTIFSKLRKPIDVFIKISIWISSIIGLIGFSVIGMFYATFTLSLTIFFKKWFAITIVSIFILIIISYASKEYLTLSKKNAYLNYSDFQLDPTNKPYYNHSKIVNQYVLQSYPYLSFSYIFFLIFNGLADKLSFGLISYFMSFIN